MAKNEAKIRFSAETKDFRENVTQANSSLAELRSELRLNAEQMRTNGTSIEGLTERKRLLQEQLEQARIKTENLSAQLEVAKQLYGENSVEAQRLSTQVNNARVAEEQILQQINGVNAELDQQRAEVNQTGNALEQLERTISQQESALSALRREYAAVALEFGENSEEAQDLAHEITELSSDLNQNRSRLSTVEAAANDAAGSFEDMSENTDEAGDSAENSSEGWTILKDVIADLVKEALSAAIEGFKELAFEAEASLDILQAKTGASAEEIQKYGDVAKEVFKNGWGESIDEVTQAIGTVVQIMGDLDEVELQNVTENAMTLSDIFGWDVKESIRAVNSMMDQFGITADEAFNLLVQGAQAGLDQNDDMLDSVNEYSVQFAQLGYDANDMFNMMVNGAKSGTWSVDKLGDAVKELNIRMSDGTVAEAIAKNAELLGLSGEKTLEITQAVYDGGKRGKEAMKELLDAILAIENPTLRYQMGVAVFGTMWEDLGETAIAALVETEGGIDSVNAAMEEAKTDAYDNLKTDVETLGSTFETLGTQIFEGCNEPMREAVQAVTEYLNSADATALIQKVSEAFGQLAGKLASELPGILEKVSNLISGIVEHFDEVVLGVQAIIAIWATLKTVGIMSTLVTFVANLVAGIAKMVALTGATAAQTVAQNALNVAMNANPIGIVITLIAALVAGIVALVSWISKLVSNADECNDRIKAATSAITPFKDGLANLSPVISDVTTLTSNMGRTIADIDGEISTAEGNINTILKTAMEERRQLRQDEIASIEQYNQEIARLEQEKLGIYRKAMNIEYSAILAEGEQMTQEAAQQHIVNLDKTLADSNAAVESSYQDQLAQTYAFHEAQGTLNSEAHIKDIQELNAWRDEELAVNQQLYNDSYAIILEGSTKNVEADRDMWNQIYDNSKKGREQFTSNIEQMDLDATEAFLSMWATAKKMGVEVPAETDQLALDILGSFENLPDKLEDQGHLALEGIIGGMKDEIPELQDTSDMTCDEIVDTVKKGLDINSPSRVLQDVGADATQGLIKGMESKKSSLNTTAKDISGKLVDNLKPSDSSVQSIGANIMSGINTGLNSKSSWLGGKISSIASGIVSRFKSSFDINSPSRVMRDTIGVGIVEGIGVGIEENTDEVTKPINALMDDIHSIDISGNSSLNYDLSAQLGDMLSNSLGGNTFGDLARMIEDLASRPISIKIGDREIIKATASANDSYSGMRNTFKTRGLAVE